MSKLPHNIGELPSQTVSFDIPAFENLLKGHSVQFVHFRAMRCPVGLVDRYDNRRPDHDHSGCSNGYVYTRAGYLRATFMGNTDAYKNSDVGFINGSSAAVTLQRFYEDSEDDVQITEFDRLYLDEEKITVPTWELFEAHITGKDKLKFPAVKVIDLMDNAGIRYQQGQDFDVQGGYIVWREQRRPQFDPKLGRGAVCSVRYTYRPYWYVKELRHQVRVVQVDDQITGVREIQRMMQECVIQREYVFEKEDKDDKAPNPESPAQVKAPPDGNFGPR